MRAALTAAREALAGGYQSRTTHEVLALIDDALAGSCGDPACPCQDGDACHYRDGKDGTKAWPKPEPQGEREAFEAWAKAEYFSLVLSGVKDLFHFGTHTEAAWLGWQAARAQAPAPVPAGWRLLKNSTHVERSFPEDWPYENGWYICECSNCGRMFNGHKRRITCKVCSMLAAAPKGEAE